jgi:hypothetical protein
MATLKKKTTAKRRAVKTTRTTRVASTPTTSKGSVDSISVRMYCHGFGDCFLITFYEKEKPIYRMVVDCGMLTGNSDTLKQAIQDVTTECAGKIDVVVQTHEHKDHISGFNLRDEKKKLLWDQIAVDNVWLAWTENTGSHGDKLAIQLKEKYEKKKKALTNALALYSKQISGSFYQSAMDRGFRGSEYHDAQKRYAKALEHLLQFNDISLKDSILGLEGAELGLTMKDAMNYFKDRSEGVNAPEIAYWNPGDFADATTTGLDGVNFYFLGPPKDYDALRKMDDKEHVEMYLSDAGLSDNFYMALSNEVNNESYERSPFNSKYCYNPSLNKSKKNVGDKPSMQLQPWEVYNKREDDWRKIELDWLHNAGLLALHLDSYTNNTSLVIAIEIEKTKEVFLFVADAQIGNWLSWTESKQVDKDDPKLTWSVMADGKKSTITASDLLSRTVFYKVGHHASHNATAKKHGLELMRSKDLVAMIPVDEEVAKKQGKRGWKMPAEDLYARLIEKTKGRIIRVDKGNLIEKNTDQIPDSAKPSKAELQKFNSRVSKSTTIIETDDGRKRPLYFEYKL